MNGQSRPVSKFSMSTRVSSEGFLPALWCLFQFVCVLPAKFYHPFRTNMYISSRVPLSLTQMWPCLCWFGFSILLCLGHLSVFRNESFSFLLRLRHILFYGLYVTPCWRALRWSTPHCSRPCDTQDPGGTALVLRTAIVTLRWTALFSSSSVALARDYPSLSLSFLIWKVGVLTPASKIQ